MTKKILKPGFNSSETKRHGAGMSLTNEVTNSARAIHGAGYEDVINIPSIVSQLEKAGFTTLAELTPAAIWFTIQTGNFEEK